MHIAAAVGTPAIVLFGPSNPARVGPFDVPHRIVENHGMDCLHCWRRKCPDPRCMTEIPADRVFDAVGDLLSENADR